jgi:uncharacterized protein YbbC (DUF1343 family)
MAIRFGIDNLLNNPPSWKAARIGLVTNHAATTYDMVPSRKALLHQSFNLQKLFSPEHGLDVQGADGHEMKDGTDILTGLPVISLYSHKLAPSADDLADIDILLFDIPDVGSRFYTYLWTMTHVMEACARQNKKLIILDRPNPISGNFDLAEGPVLDELQASFIGRWAIPVRHSCTLGELARYFNEIKNIHCNLEVILCEGWNRNSFQPDWGLRFVPTSPAIQSFESMLLYPGMCLLEATNISEGRGTDRAFCIAGAPWIKGSAIAAGFHDMGLDEIEVSPVDFMPGNSKYSGQLCGGIQLSLREPEYFQPVFFGLLLIKLVKEFYPGLFEWAPYPTLVNPDGTAHLNKLLGIAGSEELFNKPFPQFMATIARLTQSPGWKETMAGYLLY